MLNSKGIVIATKDDIVIDRERMEFWDGVPVRIYSSMLNGGSLDFSMAIDCGDVEKERQVFIEKAFEAVTHNE